MFGRVYGGTIKNLTVKNFSSDGEFSTTGTIAAYADCGATFENIAIFDCNPRVYNIGNGGIVGCVGWYAKDTVTTPVTFRNITVDNTNKISALWGSYDVACGGIVGQYYPTSGQSAANYPVNAGIHLENCHVAAQLDVYNDVCANYQYYAYRYAGMLIGSIRENETNDDGKTIPKMDKITAENCTVNYGNWNGYYYCELVANSLASYTHDHQFSRLDQIANINLTTMEYLPMNATTWEKIPTSGRVNYVIVTGERTTENAECYHFVDGRAHNHNDYNGDGKEDFETVNDESVYVENNRHIYLPFYQLFTGYGWGVSSIGLKEYSGIVTDLGIKEDNYQGSDEKFDYIGATEYAEGKTINIDKLFVGKNQSIKDNQVQVFVSPEGENSTVSAVYVPGENGNWEAGTLTFSGTGAATITITDYYFCTPTTIKVNVTARAAEEKFEIVMNNGDFLHRVGNKGTVALYKLFKAKEGVTVGTVSVTVEAVNGTAASGTYSNNAIQFSGTGVVKVTIKDDDQYCTPTELYLEVVDATNVTGLSGTLACNVVLLNDCGISSLYVSGRNTVYGNGFTATYTGNGQYLNNGTKLGVVNVSENGVLDNLRINASIYPVAYLYYSEAQNNGPSDGNNRYFYQLSAVAATGNATISNCYIYGARTNIYIGDGNVTVKDSVLECGTLANVQIISSENYTVTFENVTTIQHQMNATIGDTSKVMHGAGVLVGDGDKDNTSATAPTIVLNGDFKQYNWVTADDKDAVSDSNAKMIINGALNATAYNHTVNGKKASNLGVIYLNDVTVDVENNTGLPYAEGTVSMGTATRPVYSLKNAEGNQIYSDTTNADRTTVNDLYQPQFKYSADLGGQYIAKTDDGDEHCYREGDTIRVMFPAGDTKELDLAKLVNIVKYNGQNLDISIACKDANGNAASVTNGKISLSAVGDYTVTYTVTDTLFYDKDGNVIETGAARAVARTSSIKYSWEVVVSVSLKEVGIPNAYFAFDSSVQKIFRSGNSNIVQFIPFLSGLKIYDYDENGNEYLRFDGGDTSETKGYANISSATINNINTTGEAQGYHIVTIELADGGKLVIDMDVRANSGSSKHSGSIKVRNNVIYVVNDGTTSGKGQTWKIYSYKFVGNNGNEIDSGLVTFGTAGMDCDTATKPTSNFGDSGNGESGDSGGSNPGCVTGNTLITLADSTQKRVDELTGNELLLVWNLETGKYDTAPIVFVDTEAEAECEVIDLYFSNGSKVSVIYEHGFFDYDLGKYIYLDATNAKDYIGHKFVTQGYIKYGAWSTATLVDVVVEKRVEKAYSPVTFQHLCYYTDGMLSMPGGIEGLFNIFDVNAVTMTYDAEKKTADIEKYGLLTLEDFGGMITEEAFNAFNGAYLNVAMGKGLITWEDIAYLAERYIPLM